MNARVQDSWSQLDRLLDRALDLAPAERPVFLAQLRSDAPELGSEIERLVWAITSAEHFLQDPAANYAAPLLSALIQQHELPAGSQLGGYEIISELGRGGTATVYLAQDHKHGRRVAIKVPHVELATTTSSQRFLREIQIAAQLQHPNILPLHDSGEADGLLYYVMPYVEGESLRRRLSREPQFPVADAVQLTCEVADALGYAHAHGLVHRDIKPENILLSEGHALVADFGIARAMAVIEGEQSSERGLASGTPAYMSPEQAAGERQVDGRSDLYSLGCVLYEMLAGEPPGCGDPARKALTPPELERAASRALARAPGDRFATAQEFAAALRHASREAGESHERPRVQVRTNMRRLATIGVLAAAGLLTWITSAALSRKTEAKSVAVLPCESSGGDSTQAYVGDRWAEELIDKLSKVAGLRVVSWLSMRNYHPASRSASQIGRDLRVAALVRCSVAENSDNFGFKVQVIDAPHGSLVESRAFTRPLTASAINSVETDAATTIAAALGVTPSSSERTRLEKPVTRNTEALEALRLGRHHLGLIETRKSIEEFRKAIARDSGLAEAWAGLANASLIEGHQYARPTTEYVPPAMQAVLKALSLDPELAEAHTLLGEYFLWYNHDWASAETELRRALQLNPNSVTAHMWYGADLALVGQPQRGVPELEKAVALEPTFPLAHIQLISGLRVAGQYQRAVDEVRKTLRVDPGNGFVYLHLGMIRQQQGLIDSAVAALEKGVRLGANDADARSRLANAYGVAGRRDEANRILQDLLASPTVDPLHIARVQLGLGNRDEALSWLQRADQERSWELITALGGQDPAFHVLQSDPRFVAMRKRAGLPVS